MAAKTTATTAAKAKAPAAKTTTRKPAAAKATTKAPAKAAATKPAPKEAPQAKVRGRGGRSIAEHIRQAFAAQEPGTFLTVAQIRNHVSTEYGDTKPSAGAIQAALKRPASLPEGITPGQGGERGSLGATSAPAAKPAARRTKAAAAAK